MSGQSQEDLFRSWEELIDLARNADSELPGVGPFLDRLEGALRAGRATRLRRDALQAEAARTTRDLEQSLAQGREAASRLRNFLKCCLGHRDERLARLGIARHGEERTRVERNSLGNREQA